MSSPTFPDPRNRPQAPQAMPVQRPAASVTPGGSSAWGSVPAGGAGHGQPSMGAAPFGLPADVGLPTLPSPSLRPPMQPIPLPPTPPAGWSPGPEFWGGVAFGVGAGVVTILIVMWIVWPNPKREIAALKAQLQAELQEQSRETLSGRGGTKSANAASTDPERQPDPTVEPVSAAVSEPTAEPVGPNGTAEPPVEPIAEPVVEPVRPKRTTQPTVDPWTSAGQSATIDDVHLEFLSATVKPPLSVDSGGATAVATKPALVVLVRISNRSTDRKIMYRTWGSPPTGTARNADQAALVDEHGNAYRRLSPAANHRWAGQADDAPIEPGAFVEDMLVFEKPFPASFEFRLTLPGRKISLDGDFRLKWGAADVSR